MSKPTAIFAQTPVKNVRSSPSKPNSAKSARSQQTTPNISEASPRKCRIKTEIQSSPAGVRSANINVKSKLQFNCHSSPKVTQERLKTKPSPRKEKKNNEDETNFKSHKHPGLKVHPTSHISRGDTITTAKHESCETDSSSSDVPISINVKSMRSCFEQKENKFPSKPPPSPSPSRAKSRLADTYPATPRNANNWFSVKGILSSRSKYESSPTPTFRIPSGSNTPTPRPAKLRRSVSTGTLSNTNHSPGPANLIRSSSQTITPKHRVKFQDEITPKCFSPVLLESKGELGAVDSIVGEVTNLTVAVRVRPPFSGERSVVSVEGNMVKVKALGSEHCFTYDYCFSSTGDTAATQQDVFDIMVEPLVDAAFQGYNVCLFAYGQTGSGKSYSMMGEEIPTSSLVPERAGIIPRFSQQLFKIIEGSKEYSQTKVEISYFEIYNEKIHDLLGPSQSGRSAPLRVREHPELGPYVVDLTAHNVHSFEILQDWLQVGNSHKATAATEMNMNSSRSHSIFTVTLTQSQSDDRPSLCSKINLIDLAGSERLAHTCATADRLKEGVSINRSLLTLGKVISSLAENKKRGFIPYRESVLTWLLRESLGGNSHTAMLATISPSSQFVEETLSTLRYACKARNIINTVRINESPNEKRIRELLEEIQRLKDGIDVKDHSECLMKLKTLQAQLNQATEELSRVNGLCAESEIEIEKLVYELKNIKKIKHHVECERKIEELHNALTQSDNWNTRYDKEVKELKRNLTDAKEKNVRYQEQINELQRHTDEITNNSLSYKEIIFKLENEVQEFEKLTKQLRLDINKYEQDLEECKFKNTNYERDISLMKNSMLDIKNNTSHDHCDNQILMLQTALAEAERFSLQYKEQIKNLEKKCSEAPKMTNHDGCEKEICALKDMISELKKSGDHGKCDKVNENLKTALSEAETLVSELESEIKLLKEKQDLLMTEKEQSEKEIIQMKNTLKESENQNSHSECEARINTLKKALSVAKSMNSHIQCQNRISELEIEVRNLQSVTLSDHSQCEEKINNLFFAIEKYADENNKLKGSHETEVLKYKETIQNMENKVSKGTYTECKRDLAFLENQIKYLKEENSRVKKKKIDDENKISSLEQQVVSLTKELLDQKSQYRICLREKESNDSLCAQLQEQLIQQDRKLALPQSSRQLFDDKENWETPSKVIRRSIARHSSCKRDNDRCSLVMKVEEIHQALKDAEDICSRLKIPWVFHLEPEVTTHSWFDVNVRVWDQRTMNSVRWSREVFLGWLREMKDEIMSKSRGHKLFHSASWLQNTKDPEPLPNESDHRSLKEDLESLRKLVLTLENLCGPKDKQEVSSVVNALGKTVTQLGNKIGLVFALHPLNTNINT